VKRGRKTRLGSAERQLLQFARGYFCPKEREFFRQLAAFQSEAEVAYTRMVTVTTEPPEIQAAFRAGLDARWLFLSDAERRYLDELELRETTDEVNRPYVPSVFTLFPDLQIHSVYNGYWYWGRPSMEELRRDLREITRSIRPDWEVPAA
jgi:hypothetical protein